MASDVTTREITQALGRLRPKASASAIASRFQHMVSAGLFDRVGCGPLIKAVGRGRVREYPAEALLWARVFDALLARGAGMAEVAAVAGKLGSRRSQGDPLVLGAIDRTKWVFIMYSTGANLRLAGVADEGDSPWSRPAGTGRGCRPSAA